MTLGHHMLIVISMLLSINSWAQDKTLVKLSEDHALYLDIEQTFEAIEDYRISPDGKYVVYIGYRGFFPYIYSVPIHGGPSTQLYSIREHDKPSGVTSFFITKDSKHVVFFTGSYAPSSTKAFYSVPITGGGAKRLSPTDGWQNNQRYRQLWDGEETPDSKGFIYSMYVYDSNKPTVDLEIY